jgi:ACS family sodium-dependent inorganic phosphate cotransporter
MVTSDPGTHPKITAEELSHIQQGIEADEQASEIPWTHFLKHKAVWAIAVAHFCNNWTLYVLLSWAPTFINKGLGVELASVGLLAMIPQAASFVSINLAGNLADRLITSGMPVLRVRKLMQTVGFGGLAVCLLLVTSAETVTGAIAIMALGSALGAGSTGGFAVNHMDIAPKHAGTLMGITNTAGTIPGIVGVFLSGMILELTGSWALVFGTAAVISLVGLVVFLRYAQADKLFD